MSKAEFDAVDTDGDGYITASELLTSLADNPAVGADDIAQIVTMADENGDNRVSYEEYEKFAR